MRCIRFLGCRLGMTLRHSLPLARFEGYKFLDKVQAVVYQRKLRPTLAGEQRLATRILRVFLESHTVEVFMEAAEQSTVKVDPTFANLVESITNLNLTSCFQCRKCTNGCPVTFAMDIYPDRVIRLAILGQKEQVLGCNTIWVCSACETCTTRCPNEVDIAATMDALKEIAVKEGVQVAEPNTYAFHRAFLDDIKKRGRMFEGRLMQSYLLKSGEFYRRLVNGTIREDISLGLNMLRKGRLPLLPKGIKGKKEIKEILS